MQARTVYEDGRIAGTKIPEVVLQHCALWIEKCDLEDEVRLLKGVLGRY